MLKGGHHSEETKRKMSERAKLHVGEKNNFWGKQHTKEAKKKIGEAAKGNNRRLGCVHSEETKRKISEATKGRPYNGCGFKKGHTPSPLAIQRAIESTEGKPRSEEVRQKISESHKGLRHSEETKRKISKSKMGHIGHPCSEEKKQSMTGSNSHWWKGGITPEVRHIRTSDKMTKWRKEVFERDDYTCQSCGKRGVEIHAHHLLSFAEYPDYRFYAENGITLCKKCHYGLHRKKE